MNPIRLVLADDHALVRAGIVSLLQRLVDVEVVGEASDGHEAYRLIAAHQPTVALLDISMPGLNGVELAARVTHEFPSVRVGILSMHTNEQYVLRALQAGATAYLLKDSGTAELELAVRALAKRQSYLSPAISTQVIQAYLQRLDGTDDPLAALTSRQREVLQLVAEGRTAKEIAQVLGLAVKTVENQRAMIMERLAIHDVAGLVRFAIQAGVVELDR